MMKTLVAALIAAGTLSAQAATVSLSGTASAAVGQTFTLDVSLLQPFDGERAGDELLAFGMALSYDSSLLKLLGVSLADGWSDDSAFTGLALSGSAFATLLLIALMMGANHVAARLAFDHGVSVSTAVLFRSGVTALVVWLIVRMAGVPVNVSAGQQRALLKVGALIGLHPRQSLQ